MEQLLSYDKLQYFYNIVDATLWKSFRMCGDPAKRLVMIGIRYKDNKGKRLFKI